MLKAGERLVLRDNDKVSTDGAPVERMLWRHQIIFVSDGEGPGHCPLC